MRREYYLHQRTNGIFSVQKLLKLLMSKSSQSKRTSLGKRI